MSMNRQLSTGSNSHHARPTLTQKLSDLTALVLPGRNRNSRNSPRGRRPEPEFQIVHTPDRLRATPIDESEIPDDEECRRFIMALRNKEEQHRNASSRGDRADRSEAKERYPPPREVHQLQTRNERYEHPRTAPKPPQMPAHRSHPSWPLSDDTAVRTQRPSSPRAVYRQPPPPPRLDSHATLWPRAPRKKTSLGSIVANDGENTDSDDPDCDAGTESLRRKAEREYERQQKEMGGAAAYISRRTNCRLCGNLGIPGPGGLCPQCVQDFMVPKDVFREDLDARISADLAEMEQIRRQEQVQHVGAREHSAEERLDVPLPLSRTATVSPTPSLMSDITETYRSMSISPTPMAGHVAHQMKIIAPDAAPRKVFVPSTTKANEVVPVAAPVAASTLLERRMRKQSPADLDRDKSRIVRVGHVRRSTPQIVPGSPGWEDLQDKDDPIFQFMDSYYSTELRTDGTTQSDRNAPVSPILNTGMFQHPEPLRDSNFYAPFENIYGEYSDSALNPSKMGLV